MAAPKRTGLGRGIGALIPVSDDAEAGRPVDVFFPTSSTEKQGLLSVPGARLANLNPADIVPNANQPRTEFREEELAELVVSIREIGVLQPIVVRPLQGAVSGGPQYELIMGERRLRATKQLGLSSIPAVIKNTADEDMLRDACSRTCTAPTSTRLRRHRPTSSSSRTSGSRRSSSESASGAHARRSPTPCVSCASPSRFSARWRLVC